MCLSPINVKNRSLYVDPLHNYRAFLTVPCGRCCECKQAKVNEYAVRASYEFKDVEKRKGNRAWTHGFAYWDTLTYSEENLPKYHGVTCFSKTDVTNFLKKLRQYIKREGYVGYMRYFLATEYGGLTHRPHIHIAIFSHYDGLNPYKLRELMEKAWSREVKVNGETKLIPLGYLDESKPVYQRVLNGMGALYYIAKYVNKEVDYGNYIDYRLSHAHKLLVKLKQDDLRLPQILQYFSNKDIHESLCSALMRYQSAIPRYIDKIDKFIFHLSIDDKAKCYAPFHRQSKGFGASFMDYNTFEEMYNQGVCEMDDRQTVKKYIPLPTYFKRKLFYKLECEKNSYGLPPLLRTRNKGKATVARDGETLINDKYVSVEQNAPHYHWVLNDIGLKREREQLNKRLDKYVENLDRFAVNLQVSEPQKYKEFLSLLNGRTLTDYATYRVFYEGLYHQIGGLDDIYTIHDDNLSTHDGRDLFYIGDSDGYYYSKKYGYKTDINEPEIYKNIINQNSCTAFLGFDDLTTFIYVCNKKTDTDKQRHYDETLREKSKIKLTNKLYKWRQKVKKAHALDFLESVVLS